ncbi:hypothetical protein JCM11491_001224 [Sporobolomyces phaffii]
MPAPTLSVVPSRSSSTDSTETVRPGSLKSTHDAVTVAAGLQLGTVAHPRSSSIDRARAPSSSGASAESRSRRSVRPGSFSASRSRSTSRNAQPLLCPLSPTPDPSGFAPLAKPLPRTRPSQSVTENSAPPSSSILAPQIRRPSLTLSTKVADRLCGGSHPTASLPSPAPSPSRLCPALSLPLLSANEASIQLSSVVVQGELDNTAGIASATSSDVHELRASAVTSGSGGGAKEMLETLRDKGTLVAPDDEGEFAYRHEIPNLTQPFVLPSLERNPRLPSNLFDCTNTISIPDLPPTHPLPSHIVGEAEDEVMTMLPSPVSPHSSPPPPLPLPVDHRQTASILYRPRSRSGPGPPDAQTSTRHARKVSFSLLPTPSASSSPPPPSSHSSFSSRPSTTHPASATSSILKHEPSLSASGFLGKRRQLAGLDTTRNRDRLSSDNDGLSAAARNVKKRPALISYTSFEDEFGLKPPRLDGDYDREYAGCGVASGGGPNDEEVHEGDEAKKERKWWHLSG